MNLSFRLAIVAIVIAGALAPAAAASPSADLAAIGRDYASGRNITPCRFTVTQLQNARGLINGDVAIYAAGLGEAIDRELKRWKDRKCTAKKIAAAAGGPLRIVSVQPKGGARTESVTIKNTGRKTINLRGYALRDAGDHTLKFRSTKLKRGAKLRVVTGCRSGSKGALRRGTRYYLCRTKEIWDDAGDTVELLGRGGGLLSTKTYP
jgi:hypothetical protein